MSARNSIAFSLLLGTLVTFGLALPVRAITPPVRIYKVTFRAKALLNAAAANISDTGYVVYDQSNPSNSVVIQLFKNKTYQEQTTTGMAAVLVPSQVTLVAYDTDSDTFADTEFASVGFTGSGLVSARAYIGTIPKAGFRVGAQTVNLTARSLKGKGSVSITTPNHFTVSDTWTLDTVHTFSPTGSLVSVSAGVGVMESYLNGLHYTKIQ